MVVRKEDLRTLLPKLSLQRLMTWKVSLVETAVGGCESRAAAATATAARIWAECQKTCLQFFLKIGKLTALPNYPKYSQILHPIQITSADWVASLHGRITMTTISHAAIKDSNDDKV